ncbi:hypothetical protein CVCC1112_722 [Paenarthrobacter nicotinovorans]|uniref:hypothetical protein n=1 Tax=Paenarthrobacter nicotinovorans TaxID=29320 RepID=UPI0007CC965B|nr:hypothetical protein [Paenarthrobacter nicotinovorans]GAT86062.1 hypothetical protein CVCC1112_722 [Paenarthrobacter nicotinovorans]
MKSAVSLEQFRSKLTSLNRDVLDRVPRCHQYLSGRTALISGLGYGREDSPLYIDAELHGIESVFKLAVDKELAVIRSEASRPGEQPTQFFIATLLSWLHIWHQEAHEVDSDPWAVGFLPQLTVEAFRFHLSGPLPLDAKRFPDFDTYLPGCIAVRSRFRYRRMPFYIDAEFAGLPGCFAAAGEGDFTVVGIDVSTPRGPLEALLAARASVLEEAILKELISFAPERRTISRARVPVVNADPYDPYINDKESE